MKQIFYKLFENLKQLGIKPSIGSRTNVTPIPGSEIDRIINRPVAPKEFDYSKPEVVDSIRGIVKNASDYVGQFTERQAKTFNDNIERILNVIKPKETTADVVDLATKEKITGPGLESLMKEKGVPSISRKTIEAETLIKQFLDDDLISLNAKQIDQLSRGKAEDVFENIFGSKAKELITGKNTNESLNEVYKKLKTTKDVKGRLPDDPSFDPSDIEFKEGGSVSEDVRQLLKEEFIKIINEDPEAYPDTNAGFRRFLKRKGSPVFNYKKGGEVKEPKQTDAEIEEEIRENKKELLGKKSILDLYKGNTLFGLDLDFADKNIGGEFGKYNKKDIKDPRIGLSIIPNVQDDTSSRWGISIGPKGGGLTFMKPFSQIGLSGDWEEVPESWYEDNIPDVNVLIPELPEMKKDGGRIVKRRQEKKDGKLGPTDPLSKYESYSEEELAGNIEAKKPTFDTLEDYIMETMPMFEPKDVAPPKSYSPMPVEEYLKRRLFIDLADGGRVKKRKRYANGGVASMFRERPGYQEGGSSLGSIFDTNYYKDLFGIEKELRNNSNELFIGDPNRKEKIDYLLNSLDFIEGTKSKYGEYLDPSQYQNYNEAYNYINRLFDPRTQREIQDRVSPEEQLEITKKLDSLRKTQDQAAFKQPQAEMFPTISYDPIGFSSGNPNQKIVTKEILDQTFGNNPYTNTDLYNRFGPEISMQLEGNFPTTTEVPTVDPFSGQQVSAQDQMAFAQPQQDIFPTLNLGSADPLTNILGSQVGNLSYSEMNALRNRPSDVLSANVGANLLQGLGTGLRDFAYMGDELGANYYKNLPGNFIDNIKFLDKKFGFDPSYVGADKTGRLGYTLQGLASLGGVTIPGSNVGGGTPGMRYALEAITPYLSKTVGPVLNVLGSAPVTAFGILDTLTGSANAPEVGKGPEYFRQQLQLPENSPVSRFNQVQDPRAMMAYGGLTNTIPPVRGPSPQGVESLFTRRYN